MQIVLTPETDWEKDVLRRVPVSNKDVYLFDPAAPVVPPTVPATLLRGSFFECRGGYFRHGPKDDESLMIRLDQAVGRS